MMFLQEILRGALTAVAVVLLILLILKFIRRKVLRTTLVIAACVLAGLWAFNPGRADFNHAVFEGGRPNPMVKNQDVMSEIISTNSQCYQNPNDPRVLRNDYILFSVYDVKVSSTKTYHILGIVQTFRLLNA